jgi:hypothetical protein
MDVVQNQDQRTVFTAGGVRQLVDRALDHGATCVGARHTGDEAVVLQRKLHERPEALGAVVLRVQRHPDQAVRPRPCPLVDENGLTRAWAGGDQGDRALDGPVQHLQQPRSRHHPERELGRGYLHGPEG